MKRIVVLMSATALAGCGNVQSNAPADDRGGCVADAECGEGEVCSAETQRCEMPEGLAIQLIPTTFYDERGDHIAFSTGEPVHTHTGAAVALDGAGCPAVYKYSYLLGPIAPPYGEEVTPNPIAWRFRALGGSVAQAEFRVRSADATEIDWSPATAGDDGTFGVEIHRTGRNGFPKLELATEQYFVDFRVRDDQQQEVTRTACWEHHPLAAPVSITGLVPSSTWDGLMSISTEVGWISYLMRSDDAISVMETRVTNQTAERVTMQLAIPKPGVDYQRTYISGWMAGPGTPAQLDCGSVCIEPSLTCVERPPQDARCREADASVAATGAGTLTTGEWTIVVRDFETHELADECVVEASGASVICDLPGRLPDRPARDLRVLTRVNQIADLKPFPAATMAEVFWQGRYDHGDYSGVANVNEQFAGCTDMVTDLGNESGEIELRCIEIATVAKWIGLDFAELDIKAPTMTLLTSNGGAMSVAPYHPMGQINGESFSWYSGNEDLPGDAY
jgi:hypothetical protein